MQVYGVDVSSDKLDRSLMGGAAKTFESNAKGFARMVVGAERGDLFVMEATGSYHCALARWLYERGYQVAVVNPCDASHFMRSLGSRNKADKPDARGLAQMGIERELRRYTPPSPEQEEFTGLVRVRESLVAQRASVKNQLRNPALTVGAAAVLKDLVKSLDMHVRDLEGTLRAAVKSSKEMSQPTTFLLSIPGMGEKTAWILMAECPGLALLKSAKAAAGFAGLCPREWTSGHFKGQTKMSKKGNARIRKALYMCALAAVRMDGVFKALMDRLIAKGHTKKSALGAVMHKLMRVAYGVLASKKPFGKDRLSLQKAT
jgi:transposase